MIKAMNGWKVLRSQRKSARISTYIVYPLNIEVKPTIKGSKLFFFKEYEDAKEFADGWEQIVPCIAKNVTKPKYMLASCREIYGFWQWKLEHPNRSIKEYRSEDDKLLYPLIKEAPQGTYWAESITCLK